MKKVLRKIIKNWVTYWLPEWWWGWGWWDIDTKTLNWIIDLRVWDNDRMFREKEWLYKILNAIDDSDEVWLTSWDSWEEIINNSTSMNKISHSYAVMCAIVNSEEAMNKVVLDSVAIKELSECWNSISLIALSEIANPLYIASDLWFAKLLWEEIVQNAFFKTAAEKTSIITKNLQRIVANNDLLEIAIQDDWIATIIANSTKYMNIIVNDLTKLWIAIESSVISTKISTTQNYLTIISSDINKLNVVADNSTIISWIAWNSTATINLTNDTSATNNRLEFWLDNTTLKNAIKWNTTALSNITSNTTRFALVRDDRTILDTIYQNTTAMNSMLNSIFIELLEDTTELDKIITYTASKNKLKNANADSTALPPILYYTWLSWYSSYTSLYFSSDMDTVRANTNAMKIVNNCDACSNIQIYQWWTYNYTGSDQRTTTCAYWKYKIECWGAWSRSAAWWYACWTFNITTPMYLSIMVWQSWYSWNSATYWFWWSANGWSGAAWWWLSWVFTWNTTIQATDTSRVLVIAWWAGWSSAWTWWYWWWETWWTGSWSYWNPWAWWTQTWRWSSWNAWSQQFRWWNGSWTYWYWWWWGWWWWNGSQWDWSWDDDRGWGGGSWYVSTNYSMTWKTLTAWWGSSAQTAWKVVITKVS